MAWDANRPVPWKRLLRDWGLYAVILVAVLGIVSPDRLVVSMIVVVAILPVYLVAAGVLAKYGYVRKTFAEQRVIGEQRRAERQAAKARSSDKGTSTSAHTAMTRNRPAPTRRTSTGPSQRPRSRPARKR